MSKSFSHALTALVVVLTACQDGPVAPEAGSAGSGNDTECTTTLFGGTYDNLVVPEGATCFLRGEEIQTPEGRRIVERVKEGDGSPFPVITTDGRQWRDEEVSPP